MQLSYASATYINSFIAILWCVGCVSPQSNGPTNITRSEGDENVFIPCPFDGLVATPFWRINETFYHTTQLPYPFVASSNSSGLFIKSITRFINGTILQCFVASGLKSDPRPLRSSIWMLIVTFDPLSDPPSSSGSGSIVIQLTHQHLHFARDNITLAWSLFDKDAGIDISQPNFEYSLDISDCNPQNLSGNFSVNDKMFVVSSQGLDSNSYINVTLPSQSLSIDERFRIKRGVVTNDIRIHSECTCVDVPEPETSPYFAIPRFPTSVQPDIRCLAIPPARSIEQCHSLTNSCGDNNLDSSIYAQSIRICSDSTGTKFKMCFTNVTAEMNNTRVHFYYSRSPRCPKTGYRVQSKLYIASYKIITQANSNYFSPDINTTIGEICFSTHLKYCSQSMTYYSMSIYDVTGYLAYEQENISPGTCLSTPVYEDSMCAPFTIVVNTYNPQQGSHSQTHMIATDTAMNPCQCAMQKVHLDVSEAGTSGILRCNHTFASDINIMIEVQAVNSVEASKEFVNCSREYSMRDFQCGTTYALRTTLMLIDSTMLGSQCVLLVSNITTGCQEDSNSAQLNAGTTAAIAVVSVLIFVCILSIIIAFIIWVLRKKCAQKYTSVQSDQVIELQHQGEDPNS